MNNFRFVHAADLHLDTPFEGIGRVAAGVAEALREASLSAWESLVRLTIERDAAFLLIAGDVYDGPRRGIRAQLRFLEGLEELSERHIPVFIVHGNHDPLDGWTAIKAWPRGVTVFGSHDVERVAAERAGKRIATIHGISYACRDVTENLCLRYQRGFDPGLHIGLLHCNVGPHPEHAAYSACTVEDLERAGLDYWALGHVHRFSVLKEGAGTIAYPGTLQGRSVAAAEQGAKGALVVEAQSDPPRICDMEFVPLDRVRFLTIEVPIRPFVQIPDLQRTLLKRAGDLRATNRVPGLVVRAVLIGRGELHRDLTRTDLLEDLLKDLRQRSEGDQPLLWWESVQDRSAMTMDFDEIRARSDFSAELLRWTDSIALDEARIAQLFAQQSDQLRRAGVPRWLQEVAPEEAAVMLQEARGLAIDMLERE